MGNYVKQEFSQFFFLFLLIFLYNCTVGNNNYYLHITNYCNYFYIVITFTMVNLFINIFTDNHIKVVNNIFDIEQTRHKDILIIFFRKQNV